MPNWVSNEIRVKTEDFGRLKELLLKDNNVDFNKLIPMPKDLNILCGSSSYGDNSDKEVVKKLQTLYKDDLTQDDFVKLALKNEISKDEETLIRSYYNTQKYGYNDWYNWSLDQWGTKWNATETLVDTNNSIYFDTAWSCPFGVLEELAKHIDFTFAYADEDLGVNLGVGEAYNGELHLDELQNLNDEQKYYMAYLIKGYDECEYTYDTEDNGIEPLDSDSRAEVKEILNSYIDVR